MERLEEFFAEHRYPDVYRREEIAHELDLKEEVVRVRYCVNMTQYYRRINLIQYRIISVVP